MPKPIVVDTYALVKWINGEAGYSGYSEFLTSPSWQRIITPVTLCELKLAMLKKEAGLDEWVASLAFTKQICEVRPLTESVMLRAAEIKFKYMAESKINLSMVDSICVSLAESLDAPILTGDKGIKLVEEVRVLP
ncbi:PIN domain-containing protein [Candidatus Micrarchaeota archaeon]|nr:PIN domain-containing protein [Candidatus Micrarchaeota archaeon]